jgi:hypothetical protein
MTSEFWRSSACCFCWSHDWGLVKDKVWVDEVFDSTSWLGRVDGIIDGSTDGVFEEPIIVVGLEDGFKDGTLDGS